MVNLMSRNLDDAKAAAHGAGRRRLPQAHHCRLPEASPPTLTERTGGYQVFNDYDDACAVLDQSTWAVSHTASMAHPLP